MSFQGEVGVDYKDSCHHASRKQQLVDSQGREAKAISNISFGDVYIRDIQQQHTVYCFSSLSIHHSNVTYFKIIRWYLLSKASEKKVLKLNIPSTFCGL